MAIGYNPNLLNSDSINMQINGSQDAQMVAMQNLMKSAKDLGQLQKNMAAESTQMAEKMMKLSVAGGLEGQELATKVSIMA